MNVCPLLAHECIEEGDAHEAKTDNEHAGNGTSAEGDVEGGVDASFGGFGSAHVGAHIDVHTNETGCARENGAHRKADGRWHSKARDEGNDDKDDDANNGDGSVLPCQVGRGTGLNGSGNFLHTGISSGLGKNPAAGDKAVGDGQKATNKGKHEAGRHDDSSNDGVCEVSRLFALEPIGTIPYDPNNNKFLLYCEATVCP